MKKYIIKNTDGSEQTVMRAVYNSRKEAGASMMNYIRYHNENCDAYHHSTLFLKKYMLKMSMKPLQILIVQERHLVASRMRTLPLQR